MKRYIIILLTAALLAGCQSQSSQPTTSSSTTETATTTISETTTTTAAPTTTTEDPSIPGDGEAYSPLNGSVIDAAQLKQRPLAVMMDNYVAARPQAGIDRADIVYEVLVEGRITRYMAVFQSSMPDLIGPIRSARPYYLRLAMEYDALYAHVGGSEQAKAELKSFKIGDIDGLASGRETFWRKKHKKIPNNMYGSSESLLDWAKRRKYRTDAKFDSWTFGDDYGADDFSARDSLTITYREPRYDGDKLGYSISWHYNTDTERYERSINGEPHRDEVTEAHIVADSIIVQLAATRTIDSYGRLAINVVGSGRGYYLYDGNIIPITWKKASDRARTRFFTADGEPLVMKRGKIWVQVVKTGYTLQPEEE